ncbi:alpha/beta hydrolase [Noviherbaspirillum sp. 1P10PC]|uniref:alpha/beta hydrolase family protein n=1 Tax=Noviherbaspirillum sp. 1P10PC TaxID=3132292 RepID=UPI0039A16B6F
MKQPVRSALGLAALTLVLSACGGGSSDPTPEAQRPQDTRTFAVSEASLPFTALAGAPETDRWSGTLEGAGYRIEVPKNWNGKLVMYAHGYAGTGAALTVSNPGIRRYLIEQGYAWAASSYSRNYYDVRAGVEDTNALALAFNKIAAANSRPLAAPSKIYITGVSMGGHVTAAAIDEEALAYANHKVSYNGAVPMCGVLGDTELYDFFAAYQAAAMQLAGVPATSWPVTNWATLQPTVKSALFTTFPSATTAQGDKLKTIVQNLTGGQRPMFDVGFAGPYTDTVWGTFGRDGKMLGILNDDVVSTKDFVYQLDNSPALSAEETAFNNTIYRVQATPDANRLRSDGLRWVPKTNARFNIPVVTIHTLGDMYVPFSMEQIFKKRADAQGTSGMLVQRAIRGVAHCDFTVNEQVKAFQDMVTWESGGAKPQGDDVLTASVVADPKYGCKFTDNTLTVDEPASSGIATSRAKLAAAYSCN